jgi:ribosomal protein L7Ae-like RNA K-turn-binding protein
MVRFYSLLGLCKRAGRIVSGAELCEKALKENAAALIILAGDASENTKMKFRRLSLNKNIRLIETGSISLLGHAVGKEKRSVICVTDEGFAHKLTEIYERERMEM